MSLRFAPLTSTLLALALSIAPPTLFAGDGDVDPTFAPASNWLPGWERLDFSGLNEKGIAVARNVDGTFIVCLSVPGGSAGARIGLVKFDSSGQRITTFGVNGQVLKDAALSRIADMAMDAQGRIVVVGSTPGPAGLDDFGIVRFNADGSDDTTFAGDGGTSAGFEYTVGPLNFYSQDRPTSVTTDPTGNIVVAGSTFAQTGGGVKWGVIRLNADGSYNNRVSGLYAADQDAVGNKILSLRGGYYLVVGSTLVSATDADFGARIISPALHVASDYSDSGAFAFDVAAGDGSLIDFASDAAPAGPDRVVLAGVASEKIAVNRILIQRDGNGHPASLALDTSFVGGGLPNYPYNYVGPLNVTDTDIGYGTARTRVAIRSDGSIVLTGRFHNTSDNSSSAIVTRLSADGSEDSDFAFLAATRFYKTPTSAGGNSTDSGFSDLVIDGGRAVLVGTSLDSTGDTDGIITRLQSDLIFADRFE
ncbi:MAG: hypothetical protein ABIO49_02655 [Dokdonella sp.]